MSLRRLFVGGNWKCNNKFAESQNLVKNIYNKLSFDTQKVDVIAAPVFVHIPWVQANLQKSVQVSAQNCSASTFGAFTGEIAPNHLQDMNVEWTIIGHSERRQFYNETNDIVSQKTRLAVTSGLKVIACIGEQQSDRESGNTFKILEQQLNPVFNSIESSQWDQVVIAYEPVWAIGTGQVATPEQAQEAHQFIREQIQKRYSNESAHKVRIIYGGSVTQKNSDILIQQSDIDGFLVGGASLKEEFKNIIASCNQ